MSADGGGSPASDVGTKDMERRGKGQGGCGITIYGSFESTPTSLTKVLDFKLS